MRDASLGKSVEVLKKPLPDMLELEVKLEESVAVPVADDDVVSLVVDMIQVVLRRSCVYNSEKPGYSELLCEIYRYLPYSDQGRSPVLVRFPL